MTEYRSLRNGVLIQGGLFLVALVMALGAGYGVVTNNALIILTALGVLPLVLIVQRPYLSLVMAWAGFIFIPYNTLRTPIPFLSSPLMLIVVAGLGIGWLKLMTRQIILPKSNIYVPIFLWVCVMFFFMFASSGEGTGTIVQWYLRGMWGVPLVLLVVRTPRQGRIVLISFFVILVAYLALSIPSALSSGAVGFAENVSVSNLREELDTGFHIPTMAALAWPILYSVSIGNNTNKSIRLLSIIGASIVCLVIISSGYGSPILTLLVGFVVSTVLTFFNKNQRKNLLLISLVTLLSVGLYSLNGVQSQINRIFSGSDTSVNARLNIIEPGIEAFLNSPIVGWGYNANLSSPSTPGYGGHFTILNVAVGFGIVGLLPMLLLFATLGIDLIWLGKKPLNPLDRSLVIGLQAIFCAYVAQGITSVSFGIITWDSVFWFLMGFGLLWSSWLKTGLYTDLVR